MILRSRLAVLTVMAAACTSPRTAPTPAAAPTGVAAMRHTIDSLVSAPEFRSAHWGILIVDPERGDTLYSRNAGKLFMPASNMKLVTSSTALTLLGGDFRIRTPFVSRGPVRDGTVNGDLLVFGRGDPSVSDHMRGDAMKVFAEVADSLRAHGVLRITGRVVPAGNAFPGPTIGYGWSWSDLEDDYSAAIDELLFNEGISDVIVRGGSSEGDPVLVETRPARTFPRVRVEAITGAQEARGGGAPARRASLIDVVKDTALGGFVVRGSIPAGDSVTVTVTHRDPDEAYVAALTEALRAKGIAVDGAISAPAPADTPLDTIYTLESPPLRDIMPALMKPSQNQIAEMLLRLVALEKTGVGTADSGRAVVARQLVSWGAQPDGFIVRDGSGLARYDYLTPETIVHLLAAMQKSPEFSTFFASLPIAGVDGTIRTRMRGTKAENNLRAKTGTVAQARSLSGYVTTADGRTLLFSMLCNNFTSPVAAVTRVQDEIGAALAALSTR